MTHGPEAAKELLDLLGRAHGTEHPDLDFKRELTVETPGQKAEFAKDVALQANLSDGGSLVYGLDDVGKPVGLDSIPDVDTLASILANRLQFNPPGIDIEVIELPTSPGGETAQVLWIRIPPNRYDIPTAFFASDASWKMPVRVGTVTKYLSPVEAASYRSMRSRSQSESSPIRGPSREEWGEPDSVTETIETNLLPIMRVPSTVWTAQCSAETQDEVRFACTGVPPPFWLRDNQIWSLRGSGECETAFRQVIASKGKESPVDRLLGKRDSRRLVIGLINAEVASYLQSLGLVWDQDRRRAYFAPDNGRPRKITWQAFKRRGTRTGVGVRTRPDKSVDHWYHFAVRPRVEDLRERFALTISPTWVFSSDGHNLLRSYSVAPIATKRLNREDNARILYNIQFWAQYLSQGSARIELPTGGGGLSISTDPFTLRVSRGVRGDHIEVPEISLEGDEDVPPITWSPVAEEREEGDEEGLDRWS